MNKCLTFRVLEGAKLKMIKAFYRNKLFDIIPVFISKDIDKFIVIEVSGKLAIVINNEYEQSENSDTLYIKIMYTLLPKKVHNVMLIDTLNAYWFGFNNTINVLSNMKNIGIDEKVLRINHIKELLYLSNNIQIPNSVELLHNFEYVELD